MTAPRPSLMLLVIPGDDPEARALVMKAAADIAGVIDTGNNNFEVSVIEGTEGITAGAYFSGDNIESYGRP